MVGTNKKTTPHDQFRRSQEVVVVQPVSSVARFLCVVLSWAISRRYRDQSPDKKAQTR